MLPGIRQFDLSGRTVLVTGGSKGLGKAMAEGFASAGARLFLVSRNLNEATEAAKEIKDNHQVENANFYKENGSCWIIEQNNFEEKIEDFLLDILNNKSDYLNKKENLKKLNYQNTWINVNQKILKIINEN